MLATNMGKEQKGKFVLMFYGEMLRLLLCVKPEVSCRDPSL